MRCDAEKPLFSMYLVDTVIVVEMLEVSGHLPECAECQSDYNLLESTRSLVSSLGRRQPPSDLALKIKVALSSENARGRRGILQGYVVRLENAFNGLMFPATAGVLSAIVFFGVLIGLLVPAQVSAYDDVPSSFYTPPRLQLSDYPEPQLNLDTPQVIDTYVDA